ncbi:hypothetical protein CERSUDRAFT_77927 [Gelatoporia subvermispora B]|uniref:Uncharacterized protein n=1 Tax=Ceriporiopsis subvermispora (strain B) TaxID=914234 RepID=M2Q4W3_CERS8|nr:hypothetical protein CERSUDRAFT_77927 [Gelatoporia subvermispora B]
MSRLDNNLRLLCLSGTQVLTLLAGAPNGFRTQGLHVITHEPSDWAAIPTLLQKAARSLTKLTIDMSSVSENETPNARGLCIWFQGAVSDLMPVSDLNAFKEALKSARSLRALSIYTQPWHLPHLYELVSCIAPSSLEQLDLQSDLNGTPELSYLENLARILNDAAQFPSLRELELYYEGYPHEIGKEKTKQIIDEISAPLHARGIAQFD